MRAPVCCQWANEMEHPDGEQIYPDWCECICHVEEDE